MPVEISPSVASILNASPTSPSHSLPATPDNCFWGYFDPAVAPVLSVPSGSTIRIEAVSHHSGDAPDLMFDEGIAAIWDAIDPSDRTPGVHIMTGPIEVIDTQPGESILVRILEMTPRMPFGSNCAANWGLLYDRFGKERITIYGLNNLDAGGFGRSASPMFAFDFTERPLYDLPGVVSAPEEEHRSPFSRPVQVPVRPHFGVMGVAPAGSERISSVPPGVFGGNVDNWRLGPGAAMLYPVFHEGANLFVGDPHFAQGDGEICGTAIEASINAVIQVFRVPDISVDAPVLLRDDEWITHGFGDDLNAAMRMAAEQMLNLMTGPIGLSEDDAYSLCSVAVDFGVTQVVDGVVGCHAILDSSIFVSTDPT